jgi:hypothetical protein
MVGRRHSLAFESDRLGLLALAVGVHGPDQQQKKQGIQGILDAGVHGAQINAKIPMTHEKVI